MNIEEQLQGIVEGLNFPTADEIETEMIVSDLCDLTGSGQCEEILSAAKKIVHAGVDWDLESMGGSPNRPLLDGWWYGYTENRLGVSSIYLSAFINNSEKKLEANKRGY